MTTKPVESPSSQPMTTKMHKESWRHLYIRLLGMPVDQLNAFRTESSFELNGIDDLCQAGFMEGKVNRDTAAIPHSAVVRGPTLQGRIFAEDQQAILDSRSWTGRLKSGAVIILSWLVGLLTGLLTAIAAQILVWYFTHEP